MGNIQYIDITPKCSSFNLYNVLMFLHGTFAKTSRLAVGSVQPPFNWVPEFFPGGKVAGPEVDHLYLVPKLRVS